MHNCGIRRNAMKLFFTNTRTIHKQTNKNNKYIKLLVNVRISFKSAEFSFKSKIASQKQLVNEAQ